MYSILAGLVLGLVSGWLIGCFNGCRRGATYAGVTVGLLSGVVVWTMVFVQTPQVQVEEARWKLVSMRSSDATTAFIWRASTATSAGRYHVMVVNDDGSFSPFSTAADLDTKVFEEEKLTDTGTLVILRSVADPNWKWKNWFLHLDSGRRHYEYHVPQGTVKTGFSVN